jgi:putative nucleotidyltransferase with HDIG domain
METHDGSYDAMHAELIALRARVHDLEAAEVGRRRMEEELRESLRKLRNAMEETIHAMAVTVETRDPYTAGHQNRVARLAEAIAATMGLANDVIEGTRMAAVVHDIGKLYVPTEFLSKPTRLSDPEMLIIQQHPTVGYDILKEIHFPWPVPQIVLQHHERLDGSGYPNGLTGEDTLLEARILAVSDVVEAMTSHRPYHPALGLDIALDEISSHEGIRYDSEVVSACTWLLTEQGFSLEG